VYHAANLRLGGMIFGERTVEIIDYFIFDDQKNKFKCKLDMSEGSGLFTKAPPVDCFE